jgi:ATP phosphoribosyltransferase
MQLIGNRFRLTADPEQFSFVRRLRDFVRELIERMDAHFTAQEHFNVIANIRGESAGDVARRLGEFTDLRGLDGPTISTVIPPRGVAHGMYAIGLVVKKTQIYSAMKQLRRVGGSGVCVLPVTFVFEGATDRWQRLCRDLNIPIDEDEWRTPSRS